MKKNITIKRLTPVPVPPPPSFRLTIDFTEAEAIAFRTMLDHVGGDARTTYRYLADDLLLAFCEAGVKSNRSLITDDSHGIYFAKAFDKKPSKA